MKALSLLLALFAVSAQARSLMPERNLLQFSTDDIKSAANTGFRFNAMTITVTNYGDMDIVSVAGGKKTIALGEIAFNEIKQIVAQLSNAEISNIRVTMVCRKLPTEFRDSLAIAQKFDPNSSLLPGALRPVFLENGCEYANKLSLADEADQAKANELMFALRLLAIEALK